MKKMMTFGILFLFCGSIFSAPAGAGTIDLETLNSLLKRSKQYEFGQSRRVLTEVHDLIASAYESPDELKKAEAVLLAALQSDSSFALKDFICRELSVIGTEQSVPALTAMLGEAKTAAPAEYALVRIPSEAVDTALIKILPASEKPIQIGLLSAFGLRKSTAAVGVIGSLLTHQDIEIADAALSALGQIGTAEAAAVIENHISGLAASLKPRAHDAILSCGENLIRKGDKKQAAALFETLYKSDSSDLVRAAALGGLVRSAGASRAETVMVEAINESSLEIQTTAVRLACELSNKKALAEARKKMPQFSPLLQIRFLTALAEFKAQPAKDMALDCLTSKSAEIRLAAFQTLAAVGDGSCVVPLAKAAAEAADREQREAAREALSRLPDKGADDAIVKGIQEADLSNDKQAETAAELIRAAGRRTIRQALPAVLKAAEAENRAVRREALQTLQTIAEPGDLARLVSLLRKPNPDVEKMLVLVAVKEKQRKGRAKEILLFLKETRNDISKASAYQVLGQIGDPDSLDVLRAALRSSNPVLREAAFRGLAEWPGSEVLDDMKTFVMQGEDETTRVIAFRAYVRMLRGSGMESAQLVPALIGAMRMAPRESENKAVLAVLGEQPSEQALKAAVNNLESEVLKAEAQAAVLGICEKLHEKQPDLCRAALRKLLESQPNEVIRSRAKELLETLK